MWVYQKALYIPCKKNFLSTYYNDFEKDLQADSDLKNETTDLRKPSL